MVTLTSLTQYLELIVSMKKNMNNSNLIKYVGFEDFILKMGTEFKNTKIIKPIKYGKMKECYKNASLLCMYNEELEYVEGFANSIIPVMHAWCIDRSGNVIDPTYKNQEKCNYYGVIFKKEFMHKKILKNKIYGILEADYKNEYEILSGKCDNNILTLESNKNSNIDNKKVRNNGR